MNSKKIFFNKKAAIEGLMEKILWIAVFVILSIGLYYLVNYLTNV